MGFIQLVTDRVQRASEFARFKNLLTSYSLCIQHNVVVPKVYLVLSNDEAKELQWQSLPNRLPNVFTVRPSVFLNNRYDYMLRDDGATLQNFTTKKKSTLHDIYEEQRKVTCDIDGASMLFEEFPCVGDTLQYPTHYRLHAFYGGIALIQIVTADNQMGWCNTNGKMLATANNVGLDGYIPKDEIRESLINVGQRLSIATKQPYIRIDFVLSTRGPMFRSFACIPGDVRSQTFANFYKQLDQKLGDEWEAAEQRINHGNNPTAPATVRQDTPDDNA